MNYPATSRDQFKKIIRCNWSAGRKGKGGFILQKNKSGADDMHQVVYLAVPKKHFFFFLFSGSEVGNN